MDLDRVVADLNLVFDRRTGSWQDRVQAATALLREPRYQAAGAERLLAKDIADALRRLPPALRHEASVLLDVKDAFPRKADRWEELGAARYSSPARQWRRELVLTRLAGLLLPLYLPPTPSYRLLSLHIRSGRGLGDRDVHLQWQIEARAPSVRSFAFFHVLQPGLKNIRTEAHLGHADCEAVGRYNSDPNRHWVLFAAPLPVGEPVELSVRFHSRLPVVGRVPSLVEHYVEEPVSRLTFTVNDHLDAPECVEIPAGSYFGEPIEPINSTRLSSTFQIDHPKVGHRFSASWGDDPFHRLRSVLR